MAKWREFSAQRRRYCTIKQPRSTGIFRRLIKGRGRTVAAKADAGVGSGSGDIPMRWVAGVDVGDQGQNPDHLKVRPQCNSVIKGSPRLCAASDHRGPSPTKLQPKEIINALFINDHLVINMQNALDLLKIELRTALNLLI